MELYAHTDPFQRLRNSHSPRTRPHGARRLTPEQRCFAKRHGLAYDDVWRRHMGLHLRDTGIALRICHRYREIGSRRGGLLPVRVWVDVQLACGLLPLRLDHGGYFGLEEESWASKQ